MSLFISRSCLFRFAFRNCLKMKSVDDSLFYWSAGCTAAYFTWALSVWTLNGFLIYLPLSNRVSFTSLISIIGLFISYRIISTTEPKPALSVTMGVICALVSLSCLDDILVYFELAHYCDGSPSRSDRSTCQLMMEFYASTAFLVSTTSASLAALHVFTSTCWFREFADQRTNFSDTPNLTVTVGKPI